MLKAALLGSVVVVLAAVGASVAWFHARKPPNCTDPDTIALVHRSLIGRYRLPASTRLEDIRTIAGGFFAMRFVCVAELGGFDPHKLPPGTPIPGQVHFVSQLTADQRRHEVTVTLEPALIWVQVQ